MGGSEDQIYFRKVSTCLFFNLSPILSRSTPIIQIGRSLSFHMLMWVFFLFLNWNQFQCDLSWELLYIKCLSEWSNNFRPISERERFSASQFWISGEIPGHIFILFITLCCFSHYWVLECLAASNGLNYFEVLLSFILHNMSYSAWCRRLFCYPRTEPAVQACGLLRSSSRMTLLPSPGPSLCMWIEQQLPCSESGWRICLVKAEREPDGQKRLWRNFSPTFVEEKAQACGPWGQSLPTKPSTRIVSLELNQAGPWENMLWG